MGLAVHRRAEREGRGHRRALSARGRDRPRGGQRACRCRGARRRGASAARRWPARGCRARGRRARRCRAGRGQCSRGGGGRGGGRRRCAGCGGASAGHGRLGGGGWREQGGGRPGGGGRGAGGAGGAGGSSGSRRQRRGGARGARSLATPRGGGRRWGHILGQCGIEPARGEHRASCGQHGEHRQRRRQGRAAVAQGSLECRTHRSPFQKTSGQRPAGNPRGYHVAQPGLRASCPAGKRPQPPPRGDSLSRRPGGTVAQRWLPTSTGPDQVSPGSSRPAPTPAGTGSPPGPCQRRRTAAPPQPAPVPRRPSGGRRPSGAFLQGQ